MMVLRAWAKKSLAFLSEMFSMKYVLPVKEDQTKVR
jgi:hypothetical protein